MPNGPAYTVIDLSLCEKEVDKKFLQKDFSQVSFKNLPIDKEILEILEYRYREVNICMDKNAPLAAIFLIGSILEGTLLGIANANTRIFNQAKAAPKHEGKVKYFNDWNLGNFIDVACETKFIGLDVKNFSHAIREFRNYIHPKAQISASFNPDKDTAAISLQVLRAAIADLEKFCYLPLDK